MKKKYQYTATRLKKDGTPVVYNVSRQYDTEVEKKRYLLGKHKKIYDYYTKNGMFSA